MRTLAEKETKVLKYFDRFLSDDINIVEISKITGLTSAQCFEILMSKMKKDKAIKEQEKRNMREGFDSDEAYQNVEIEPYRESKTIYPLRVEELDNNKVRVTYPSKMNNYEK